MKISMIVLHFGYVEESYASFMVFRSLTEEPFESSFEALNTLVHSLLVKYIEDWRRDPSLSEDCCRKFRERAQKKDRFCAQCGRKLGNTNIDLHEFSEYMVGLLSQTMDGYGEMLSDIGPWTEFSTMAEILSVPPEETLEFPENAERFLPLALKGDEFDDPEHRYHELSDALRSGVKEYQNDHAWIEYDPTNLVDIERILDEHYRVEGTRKESS